MRRCLGERSRCVLRRRSEFVHRKSTSTSRSCSASAFGNLCARRGASKRASRGCGARSRSSLRSMSAQGVAMRVRTGRARPGRSRLIHSGVCRLGARVEAEMPAPLVDVLWNAGAGADRANMHIAKVDVPSFLVRAFAAAAGEGGIGHSWKIVDDRAAWPAAGARGSVSSERKGLVNRTIGFHLFIQRKFAVGVIAGPALTRAVVAARIATVIMPAETFPPE